MATRMQLGETSCGPLCQHPGCWQSNVRSDKGFPRLMHRPEALSDFDLDLPTVKTYNMLDDYGEDTCDNYPAKYGGKPYHERSNLLPEMHSPRRFQSIKATRAPQTSPKSTSHVGTSGTKPTQFKVVEVQEVFDPEDLRGTWDDTFISKSYFVWVPNKKKKRRGKKTKQMWHESGVTMSKKGPQFVNSKDMTEDMVPKEIENSRLTARPIDEKNKKHRFKTSKKKSRARSPTLNLRAYSTGTPRTARASTKMEFDHDGPLHSSRSDEISIPIPTRMSGWCTPRRQVINLSISELLDLPREILVQVLDNTRQSDLMSREKIHEIIRKFMPPQMERGYTNMSLTSNDLLQQKKLNLHEGNKNLRQPQLMETKPVFYLDDDVIDEPEDEDLQRSASPYGSLKELYLAGGTFPGDFSRYKKPLPSITDRAGRAVSAGDVATSKIPSISLGLPELPTGIRQTKPFTYKRKTDFDFTLAPVPTPPTSIRSTATPGSDHGTTIRVNVPSPASDRSEKGSASRQGDKENRGQPTPDQPLHAVSPTFSTGVPHAPATTPATIQPSIKSAPLIRDPSGSTMPTVPNTPQEWPPREAKTASPSQSMRAPVNTPGSLLQDQMAGLGTIQESVVQEEYSDQPVPVSRGRSVRFEIPEVPPPPSSPQLSDKDSTEDQKEPSRNTVTVNTTIPKETPSSSSKQPLSAYTIRSDANTVNTSLKEENTFVSGITRELSMVSSPEPWPQVNEADFDVAPAPSPESKLHETPPKVRNADKSNKDHDDKSNNAVKEESAEELEGKAGEVRKELDEEYINKNFEQTSVVKKLMEDSRKAESPAPPPPSPEAKEDEADKIIINKTNSVVMTPVMEEGEHEDKLGDDNDDDDEDVSMTVMQIPPKGPPQGLKKSEHRQLDTFVNIDIPASFEGVSQSPVQPRSDENFELENQTIPEEPESTSSETESKRDVALSVQSTLANRTISEREDTEYTTSMVEPAMSQASQGPALSEDFSDKAEKQDLLGDWTGMVVGASTGPDTQAMLSSDRPDMTEEGGDHEGFKEDLRKEYEKLSQETDGKDDNNKNAES